MRTTTIGNKGERLVQNLVEAIGFTIVKKWNTDSSWDLVIKSDDTIKSLEIKTQPDYLDYSGFSVEIGNKKLGNYAFKPTDFIWEGSPCVYTGLAVSKADTQVFTNGKNIIYLVSTKALKEWFKRVYDNDTHKIRFGGYDGRSLQAQITIEEIEKLGQKIDLRKKRGRKRKIASTPQSCVK
jgi:hypothetical protein